MDLFQDAESVRQFSENLTSLVRRVFERDYSGVSNPNPERSIDDLSEGHKIVELGKHLFYEDDTLEFQFIPEAREGSIVDIRNRFSSSGEPNPKIEGRFNLGSRWSGSENCSGFEITLQYKMPNGKVMTKLDELPENYGRDNALNLGHFVEVFGKLPTRIDVHLPRYSSSVDFHKFKGDVNDAEAVRKYIVEQVVQGIEINRRGEMVRINDYYGCVESTEKERVIENLNEGTATLKASIANPSAELYVTAIRYDGQVGFSFRRTVRDDFRREGFNGRWVANTLTVRMREVSDEALEVLPHLLQLYLAPELNQ